MTACTNCGGTDFMSAAGKVSDSFNITAGSTEYYGYVPAAIGIGSGDYMSICVCLKCGTLRGWQPKTPEELAKIVEEYR